MEIALFLLKILPLITQLVTLVQVVAPLLPGPDKKAFVMNTVHDLASAVPGVTDEQISIVLAHADEMTEEAVRGMKELTKKLNAASSGTFGG